MANELAQLRALREEFNRRPTLATRSTSYHNSSSNVEMGVIGAALAPSVIMRSQIPEKPSARFPSSDSRVKLPEQFNRPRKRLESLGFGQDVDLTIESARLNSWRKTIL